MKNSLSFPWPKNICPHSPWKNIFGREFCLTTLSTLEHQSTSFWPLCFWWEVCHHSYSPPPPTNPAPISNASFVFSIVFFISILRNLVFMYLVMAFQEFVLFWVHSAWICRFISFTKFGEFEAIISPVYSALSFFFSPLGLRLLSHRFMRLCLRVAFF